MKTYEAMLPSGKARTKAVSMAKAIANFRYRLVKDGMPRFKAMQYDLSDCHEVA